MAKPPSTNSRPPAHRLRVRHLCVHVRMFFMCTCGLWLAGGAGAAAFFELARICTVLFLAAFVALAAKAPRFQKLSSDAPERVQRGVRIEEGKKVK